MLRCDHAKNLNLRNNSSSLVGNSIYIIFNFLGLLQKNAIT